MKRLAEPVKAEAADAERLGRGGALEVMDMAVAWQRRDGGSVLEATDAAVACASEVVRWRQHIGGNDCCSGTAEVAC